MNPQELLNFLYKNNVAIDLDGDDLLIDAPEDFLDDDLIGLLGQHKIDIVEILRRFNQSAQSTNSVIKHISLAPYTCNTTLAQERMLFLEELTDNNSYYNLPFAYKVSGALNRAALTKAFSLLIKNHEILRTTYIRDNFDYVQLINAEGTININEMDISLIDNQNDKVIDLLHEYADYKFRLDTEWPLKINIITLSNTESIISINLHHIAADGLSARRIVQDLSQAYNWFLDNPTDEACPDCSNEYQYSDYARWQTQWLQSQDYIASKEYWTNKLRGAPHLHSIPTDFLRPSQQTTNGEFYSSNLTTSLSTNLITIARLNKTTPFVIFQTAFAALLSRYSGEKDIVFGIAAANRYPSEFINSIGLFVNTLAMRFQLTEGFTFSALLAQAIETNDSGLKHQSFPFDSLVDILQTQRDLSYNSLIQIMLVMQDDAARNLHMSGTEITPINQKQKVSKFDFSLHITPKENSFNLEWEYNTDLFKNTTIATISTHFIRLLEAFVETPDNTISKIPLIDSNEVPQTIDTDIFPPLKCVHQLIEEKILLHPDAIAIIDGDREFTYQELNDNAERIATQLLANNKNIKRVGLCLHKSAEMITAFFAILKMGAVYVPLDPSYPKERLEFMVNDSGMDVLITSELSNLPEGLKIPIPVLRVGDLLKDNSHKFAPIIFSPESPAYIIYTSGSTGKPKGVLVSHKSLFYSLFANQALMQISNTDSMPTIGSQAFGVSLLEILLPLMSGGTVLVLQKADILNLDSLTHLTNKVTVLHAVPSLMRLWLDLLIEKGGSHAYPNLRLLLVGGEAVPDRLLKDIKAWRPHVRLLELYGMTELAVVCSSYEMENHSAINYCIGKPHPNTEFYVLNEDYQHQPIGVSGELHIGGLSLASEYINQPAITNEKFVVNPFDTTQRLYKSGDRVKRLADGHYEFLGRVDFQVSVRGVRIECGEIETLSLQVEGVKQAVAHVFDTQADNQVLTLYFSVVSESFDHSVIAENIRAHLHQYLPDYMCPSIVQKIDVFPLNPNGKVDRKALPVPDHSQHQKTYLAPRTRAEEIMCDMWQEILGVESVGITDNFFELGGHSLSATRLVARINQTFNVTLPLKSLFATPTVENVVLAISALENNSTDVALKTISRDQILLPSFAQQRLWLLDQIDGGSAHYNLTGGLRLSGHLNYDALNKAFNFIIDRHESLRTCFALGDDGQPIQIIQAAAPLIIAMTDLSALQDDARNLQKAERILAEASYVFDLRADVMLRAHLIKIADDQHMLVVTLHHIASDGWSMSILINEFSALYSAYLQGHENPLPPLVIQYADYAHWQRNWLQGDVLDKQLDYWATQLASLPVVHSLPLDHPRPVIQGFAGATYTSHMNVTTLKNLNSVCQSQGATLFMGLHAAFAVLLARYSNETDIVVGSPIANREQAEVAGLIGFFVNTLVLRSDLSENPSFTALLNQSKRMLLDAYAHQQVPFEQIVERLQPERSLSHSPLFQVALVLQNNTMDLLDIPDLTLSIAEHYVGIAKYDLTLTVTESEAGLALAWEYNTDLFEQKTIARMANHFALLINALVETPNENVFTIDMLSAPERQQLLVDWNNTQVDYPSDKCIHELFEAQVENNPDAIAVVFENQHLTYSELNQKANQLAHYLISEKQVKPDTLVGICVDRSLDMVIGILAILKAGGAYVPLDPEYPEARLKYMLDDAKLTTVLTQRHLRETTPVSDTQAVCLDNENFQQQLHAYPLTNPDQNALKSTHLAYVIYTSGSTGNPKGVLLTHTGLHNLALSQAEKLEITPTSRILQFASVTFDAATWEWNMALTLGASLILLPNESVKSPKLLSSVVAFHQVTHATLPPVLLPSLDIAQWRSVKTLVIAGDACSESIAREWSKDRLFINAYGPSEVTVCATMGSFNGEQSVLHIGKPISNIQTYVLNKQQLPCPQGVAGELHIGGVGLARGYLNRADLTAEKFIPNPFYDATNPVSSTRLYKTGDLVRWLTDGNMEFLGRIDHQVKIRGFRIELGEIENALSTHTHVNDAVVVAKASAAGDKRLVAYVVTAQTKGQEEQSEFITHLRHHLSETLPDYMVPSAFVLLEQLPLTPNGKVDRKALPEPDISVQQHSYVAPRNETEKILSEIWQEVLGIERVGITDNFFELGGHSLSATRLVSQINAAFNTNLPLKAVFISQTLERLGQALLLLDKSHARPALYRVSREQVLLSSYAQQRLWLLDQIDGGSAHYNMPGSLKLSGQLNYDALTTAFNSIIERHESLRTFFAADAQGQPIQVIQAAVPLVVPLLDLSELEEGARQLQLRHFIANEANRVFDLRADVMLRAHLIKIADDQHMLVVTLHHIASDGWSMSILINEFSALYSAYVQGHENPLPPLVIQYADYAHWQRNWLQGDVLDKQLDYWATQLASLPVVHSLPLDHTRPALQSFSGAIYKSQFDANTSKQLSSLCQSQNATLFMGLHAVFSVLLARYSNETDIVVGSPIANREQAEVAGLIGFFVNTLVLRSDLSENPSFTALLNQSKRMLLDAYAHQQVPFEQIVERLQPERSLSHSPLFQVMLVLQNNEQGVLELPGLTLSPIEQTGAIAKYDLTLTVTESEQGLGLDWEYNTDLFEQKTIARMANHFELLLTELIATPNENVFSVDMLNAQERQQLLVDWNNTQVDYPNDKCIHELFETQVQNNPNAIAVIFENQTLSYQQLNEQANQLAHYLINEKQVKPDTLVGICVERSLDMVVGIIAILKAGGAYVPLDPEYPEARLKYMLDDAKLATVLTQHHLRETTPVSDAQAVCLDDENFQQQLHAYPITNPDQNALKSTHLAYVIYTSGSTGNPKGVMIQHRNTVAFLSWAIATFNVQQLRCVLASTSVCFDLSIFEMFAPLSMGGSFLVVKNILALRSYQGPHAISLINTVPSAAEALLAENSIPASVKTINLAGEPLKQKIVDRLYDTGIDSVYDLYGPSEDTTYSTFVLRTSGGISSIGKPIHNSQVYVLNQSGQLVGKSITGELHIGGVGLARGYLNRADLTAEKFIPNPFYDPENPSSSERLYKTGDLVRWLPDGNLEYLGRIDHQVKIRGFRIELGEIENTLSAHADVKDAIVLAKESASGDKRLVAYVVNGDSDLHDESEFITHLRHHLSETLPDYMVPSAFVLLDSLPLTPNGKVDRKALPNPDFSAQQHTYLAPRTDGEKILCEMWQDILGVAQVGISDNFFQLGGHSLSAARLVARINQTFKVSLPLKVLFTTPTVDGLAVAISALDTDATHRTLEKVARDQVLLASHAQQRYWLMDQVAGGGSLHNMPGAFRLLGNLNYTTLNQVFTTILERHESLRTCFSVDAQGQLIQSIQPTVPFTLAVTDLSLLEAGTRQLQQAQLMAEDAQRVFALSDDLMLRAQLLKLADNDHVLLVAMHHIASDGWSLGVLINEVRELYSAYHQGLPNPLAPLAVQYADYAHWQRQTLADHHDSELRYWLNELSGAPESTALPLDYPRHNLKTNSVGVAVTHLERKHLERFSNAIAQHNGTLFSGLFASLSLVLHRWCAQSDVVVGVVDAGRDHPDIEPLIGCFVNTLAIRSHVDSDEYLPSFLTRTCAHINDVMAHKAFPFDTLVNAINPDRAVDANPLFNVGLLLQNFNVSEVQVADLAVTQLAVERTQALLDLRFVAEETPEGLTLSCDYRQELFTAESIALVLEAYQKVIAQVIELAQETEHVNRSVADLAIPVGLLQQAERARQRHYTVCVAGTFTLEPVADSFYFWRNELGLDLTLEFTPFQQVFQQLLDAGSELRRNQNGFNLLLLSLQDWLGVGDSAQQHANLKDSVQRFISALDEAQRHSSSSVPYIVMLCPSMIEVCGDQDLLDAIAEQQHLLQATLQPQSRVHVVLPETLERDFALENYCDVQSYRVGHIPYSSSYYSALMTKALRLFSSYQRKPYKVLVLDCDNTLWHGVCAETGAQGVQVSDSYQYVQNLAIELHAKGLLLCLCSANEPDDVWAVFDQQPAMMLTRKHLVSSRINWEPKWKNIQSLADELNLGLDSFIFIDDDALQCAQMKDYCPQVLTLQLPVLSDDIPAFFNNVWALDIEQASALNEDRTALYAQNNQREQLLKRYRNNRLEFLDSLALTIDLQALNQHDCARAAELLLRTNQFNFTGVVIDEADLIRTMNDGLYGVTARVDDRFGHYGLVGLALFRVEASNLTVINMVLSCRALGRGVEYAMLKEIALVAQQQGIQTLTLPFTRTARNTPALQFLNQLRKVVAQQSDESISEYDNSQNKNLFTATDILQLDYRALLKSDDEHSNAEFASTSSTSSLTEQESVATSPLTASQLLTPLHYSKIAELSQRFTQLDERIQTDAQQRQRATPSLHATEFVAPRNELETRVAEIWKEILGVEKISITDNFFQLGGNSLLAARLVRKINLDIDENFKISHIFLFPTIAESAQVIAQNLLTKPAVANKKFDSSIDYAVPVNKLFYKNKALDVIAYHTGSIVLDIQSKSVTFDILQQAFSLLIQIHPILNSKQYVNADGELVHTFKYTNEKFNLIYKDFTVATEQDVCNDPWLNCDEYITTIPRSFSFTESDHLFKAYLFNCGETLPQRLFIIWHHNILDGFSIDTVVNDFDEILNTLLEGESYNTPKNYTNITEWYDVISANAKVNWTEDFHYWKNRPWNQVKSLPQDHSMDDFSANAEWADETTLASMQSLWQEEIVSATMRECLARAISANKLSVEKTRDLYSTTISQQGINAFDAILLAISRVISNWAKTNVTLIEIINSGRGLIFPDFDNTRTIGDIAFNAPLLINTNLDKPTLLSLRKIYEERQDLPRLALSYKWNKNILEMPEYADFPQSQILINYDTGNRYEAGNGLNLVNNGHMTPGYTNSNYKDISPELIAKDRIYFFVDIRDSQLFCHVEIPGYDGGVIYKNPYYHPSRIFTLSRDVLLELEKIIDELIC